MYPGTRSTCVRSTYTRVHVLAEVELEVKVFTVTGVNSCGYSYKLQPVTAVSCQCQCQKDKFHFFLCQHQHQHDLFTTCAQYNSSVVRCTGVYMSRCITTTTTTHLGYNK